MSMHNAAREMVFVAEQGVMADKNRLDPTWQEMLNHATCKVSQVSSGSGTSLAILSSHLPLSSFLLPSSPPSALIMFQAKPFPSSLPFLASIYISF